MCNRSIQGVDLMSMFKYMDIADKIIYDLSVSNKRNIKAEEEWKLVEDVENND